MLSLSLILTGNFEAIQCSSNQTDKKYFQMERRNRFARRTTTLGLFFLSNTKGAPYFEITKKVFVI